MRNDGQANFFQRFPQRVKLTVRWVKTLHRGMKLEPANTQLACLTLSFLDSRFTKPRINGPKRQQHVIIARRTDNYVVNGVWYVRFNLAMSFKRDNYGGEVKLEVVIVNLVDGLGTIFCLELFGRIFIENLGHGLMALLIHLDMYKHVNL